MDGWPIQAWFWLEWGSSRDSFGTASYAKQFGVGVIWVVLCPCTGNTAKNGIAYSIVVPNQVARRKPVQHSQIARFPDGAEPNPDTK
jgi:hypothetical protein